MASALAAGVERAFESDLLGIAATPSSLRPSAPHLRTQLAAQLGERTFRQIHEKIREAVRDESRDEDERYDQLVETIQATLGAANLNTLPLLLKLVFLEAS